ncbi:MAG: DoxX family protein [Woeseiaceae bacterium]|nr:DoxX family protein [Woeseiaceae bacterium]
MNDSAAATRSEGAAAPLAGLAAHAHWCLRVALASVFLFHGIGKLVDVAGFAEMMGLPVLVAWLVTFAEVGGGIGIIVGAFGRDLLTRISAAVIVPVMLGAIFTVHWGQWSFAPSESHPMGGMEFQVVLMLIALYFVAKGNDA